MAVDEKALIEAAKKLMDACYDPEISANVARTIGFTLRGNDGSDNGDWEIEVRPTRIPEGRGIRPSEITRQ